MKTQKLDLYFGTKGYPSQYDYMNFNELLKHILHADYFREDKQEYMQAFQNKFSKLLGIPTIKLKVEPMFFEGAFYPPKTSERIENVKIDIDLGCDTTEAVFTILHEVKHSQQAYNLHKFCNFSIVPKDDLCKAILLSDILFYFDKDYAKATPYHFKIEELDAFAFEINSMYNIMNKYPLYGNFNFNLFLRELMFSYLYAFKYNNEGINNPEIKKAIQNFKRKINIALSGQLGDSCKSAVKRVLQTGFNVEKAYMNITSNLDKYSSLILYENYMFNKLGAKKIKLATNGELNYAPENDDCLFENMIEAGGIDPQSEYGTYIKKYACTDNGEYDKLFKGFCKEKNNELQQLFDENTLSR